MLYELFALARVTKTAPAALADEAKTIALTLGKLVVENRGVVRKVQLLGTRPLPEVIKAEDGRHFQTHNFLMLFDASAGVAKSVARAMGRDPRVVRGSLIRVRDKDAFYTNQTSVDRAAFPEYKHT